MKLEEIQATVRSLVAEKTKRLVAEATKARHDLGTARREAARVTAGAQAEIARFQAKLEAKDDELVKISKRVQSLEVELAVTRKKLAAET